MCRYPSIEIAMEQLLQPDTFLDGVAVDTLAAGLIKNALGGNVIRQSGRVEAEVTYGIILRQDIGNLPANTGELNLPPTTLAQCIDLLVRTGPFKYSILPELRTYADYLAFPNNADLMDQNLQADVGYNAMVQAAYILPLSTLGFLLFVFYFNRSWDKHVFQRSVSGHTFMSQDALPVATTLPPTAHNVPDDDFEDYSP